MRKSNHRNNEGLFVTKDMAAERYNLGVARVMDLAREAEAIIKYGRRVLIDTEKCDAYLRKEYTE